MTDEVILSKLYDVVDQMVNKNDQQATLILRDYITNKARETVANISSTNNNITEGLRLIKTIHSEDGKRTSKVYRDTEWEEYRVKYFTDKKYAGEDSDYHTSDKDDAIGTADNWIKHGK